MIYRFQQIEVDTVQYRIVKESKEISVEPQVFDLLVYLIKNKNRVLSHNELLNELWKDKVVTESALTVQIKKVRNAIGDTGKQQKKIKTIHGRGYQFIFPVELVDEYSDEMLDPVFTTPLLQPPTIAVQEFKYIGDEESKKDFVSAISEELRIGLSKYSDIIVLNFHSIRHVSEQSTNHVDIARELNARYILTGMVQIQESQLRVSASLIDATTGHRLWSDLYKRPLLDLLKIQDELTTQVLNSIVSNIERYDHQKIRVKQTDQLSAYEFVLLGRHLFKDWSCDCEGMIKSRDMFEKAVSVDPHYASAYAWLAATYSRDFYNGCSEDSEKVGLRCLKYAKKAIELDPDNFLGHYVYAYVCWAVKSDFDEAKTRLEIAIRLNPNYYWNYCTGCWFSLCNGDYSESIIRAKEAVIRNPLLPDDCLCVLALTFYVTKEYEDAIFYLCQMDQPTEDCCACLAACYAQLDKPELARDACQKYNSFSNRSAMSVEQWHNYWYSFYKFKSEKPIAHIIEGLRIAGLVSTSAYT